VTDQLAAWGTLAAALAAFVTLFFTYMQIRKAVDIRLAERAESLMGRLIDIEHVAVEHPDLAPYIFEGAPLPIVAGTHRDAVLAYALMYVDFAEMVGWQITTGEMSEGGAYAWQDFFKQLYEQAEAVRRVFERGETLYCAETKWLLGTVGPPETIERLSRKGARDRI
jgi:hypothetical protein